MTSSGVEALRVNVRLIQRLLGNSYDRVVSRMLRERVVHVDFTSTFSSGNGKTTSLHRFFGQGVDHVVDYPALVRSRGNTRQSRYLNFKLILKVLLLTVLVHEYAS